MKLTRIIALAIISGTFGAQGASAQQLRTASPPAEVPPSSYQGRQYVDSRGCVYIRAGIDGLVNWVPRVERNRRQVCGFQPTNVSGSAAPVSRTTSAGPELITLPAADQPTAAAQSVQTARSPVPSAGTRIVTQQKPTRVAPAPVSAAAAPQPKPQTVRRVTRIEAAPVVIQSAPVSPQVSSGPCSGLSDISRQYTNTTGVRCGPQPENPVEFGPQSSLHLPANTRVLPAHLYQERQLARGIEHPAGYRAVWQDDRLNPRRAEQDLFPRAAESTAVPNGFARVAGSTDRHNPSRGQGSASGDARMAQVWTNTVPRKLAPVVAPQTITAPNRQQHTSAQLSFLSEEASQQLAQTPRYVRADVYADTAAAQQAATRLSGTGLPVRMGRLTRQGQTYKVVLAGPFHGDAAAQSALSKVRKIGFSGARLSK